MGAKAFAHNLLWEHLIRRGEVQAACWKRSIPELLMTRGVQPTVQPSKVQPALKTLLIMLSLFQTSTCLSTGVCQHISPWRSELLFPHLLLPPAPSLSTGNTGSSRPFFPGVLAFMPCGKAAFLCCFSCCCLCSSPVYLLCLSGWLQGFSKSGFKT